LIIRKEPMIGLMIEISRPAKMAFWKKVKINGFSAVMFNDGKLVDLGRI